MAECTAGSGPSRILVYALAVFVTGAMAGTLLWAVLFSMHLGISAIWDRVPVYLGDLYPLIVCIIGGVVLGLFARRFGQYPDTLPQVMAEVKEKGRYEYRHIGRMSVGALLPLVFGGSVGPEAGLTGVIAAMCTWVGDRMRWIGGEVRAMTEVGMYAALSAIFAAPLFGFAGVAGDREDVTVSRGKRLISYVLAIVGALLPLILLSEHFGSGLTVPRYERISYVTDDLLWLIPICLIGAVGGLLFHISESAFSKVSEGFGERYVTKAVIAGTVLGLCGVVLPMTMFSGELQMEQLDVSWTTMSASILLATGFLKIVLTAMCVNMGWRGGHFFPVIFSGVAIGYGLATVFGIDPVFSVCVVTAAVVGGVTGKPLMAVLLLFLCFPLYDLPVLALAALVGAYLPRVLRVSKTE